MQNNKGIKVSETIRKAVQREASLPHKRRHRAILFLTGVAILIVFAILAIMVSRIAYFQIDLKITRFIQSWKSPLLSSGMSVISWVGFSPQSFLFTAFVVASFLFLRLRWEALVALLGCAFEELLNLLLKAVIHRPRPSADLIQVFQTLSGYSFPSGHVMFYACLFGYLWFLCHTLLRPSWKRTVLSAVAASQVLLIGMSRIYLGEHWASDVLGAYLIGSVVLIAVIQFYRWGKGRFLVR